MKFGHYMLIKKSPVILVIIYFIYYYFSEMSPPSVKCFEGSRERILKEVSDVDEVSFEYDKAMRDISVVISTPLHYQSRSSYKILNKSLAITLSECEGTEYVVLPTIESKYNYSGFALPNSRNGSSHLLRKYRKARALSWSPAK